MSNEPAWNIGDLITKNAIMTLDQAREEHVRNVLEALGGNITAVARALDVDRRTLYRMCERWKIDISEYRGRETKPSPDFHPDGRFANHVGYEEEDAAVGLGNPIARSHP